MAKDQMSETSNQRRGRINRAKGKRKQAWVRRQLEDWFDVHLQFSIHKQQEESWTHLPWLLECKAGSQVGPIHTRYQNARAQAEAAKAPNDERPFVYVAAPDQLNDAYLIFLVSDLPRLFPHHG